MNATKPSLVETLEAQKHPLIVRREELQNRRNEQRKCGYWDQAYYAACDSLDAEWWANERQLAALRNAIAGLKAM
jgi:hypothetical protein